MVAKTVIWKTAAKIKAKVTDTPSATILDIEEQKAQLVKMFEPYEHLLSNKLENQALLSYCSFIERTLEDEEHKSKFNAIQNRVFSKQA